MGFLDIWARFISRIKTQNLPLGLKFDRNWAFGFVIGSSFFISSASLALLYITNWRKRISLAVPKRPIELRRDEILDGVTALIGNTPLVRIKSLSELTGCEILGKAEYLNPGGSPKDRVALRIIEQAEEDGLIHPHTGSTIFEGTVGSTGISIATVAKAKGHNACIIMPDDVAAEKSQILEKLGAQVIKVRPVSIVSTQHFVNIARQKALDYGQTEIVGPAATVGSNRHEDQVKRDDLVITSKATHKEANHKRTSSFEDFFREKPRGLFADQFENLANYEAHYYGTGPETWRQTNGSVDAFVAGAGTGGTLAGTGTFLKEANKNIKLVLADPQGSGLYHKIKNGVMYSSTEAEGTRRRYQVDTVVEGIGINRITANFEKGLDLVDDAIKVTDLEAVIMSRHLVEHDGLFLGSSSAVNLVAACRYAKRYQAWEGKKTVVTILCDSGSRHYSKFWSDEYLRENKILPDGPLPSLESIL
ncbi:PALP-domain-containing protein [Cystobasidium minutum MCA 4210]|uniref:PALP-domain-containing protein n=1 Tax=Cystobasidium minutum MCA 4210 TaxID=1397322 RepID=UPI0034CD692F|eukprot:jgi/Rhomi1/42405/CE42404_823